jgi:hypothetical protein
VPATLNGNRLLLPPEIIAELDLEQGDLLAFVQRKEAVVLKKVGVQEQAGGCARIVDRETARQITRVAQTSPLPAQLLPALQAQYGDASLRYDVRTYLAGRPTLAAWKARKLIGSDGPDDGALREELAQVRLREQDEDGSWGGDVVRTARALRELGELGLASDAREVRAGVDWLLARPQSSANPGMFFLTDELVAKQAAVVESRAQGKGGRFREIKKSEQRLVMAGDDLINMPCGPRIMWPNALAIEALLGLGYEGQPRVRAALELMVTRDWCECGYQHGLSSWRDTKPVTDEQIAQFESECMAEYRYGGLRNVADLVKMDVTAKARVVHRREDGVDVYFLAMADHIQGCEAITTRAMSQVKDTRMRRFAEAHLWRFASRQRADGTFPPERYGSGFTREGLLQLFARYDHPVSKVVIVRSLPWIVEIQNADGSWGEGPRKDAATLAVLTALRVASAYLPHGLLS